ncbi:PREDICTED: folic acid synthesis protein FOL1-like isoform X2 [Branchiostoma belcheri]|nr:PREDICTED: folic acid synthesis protein FOL1-like isoform X2 [Branchiostoma belcheri]XP_019639204.1 PREDICTED: folic acid synthesis protein FOL1-like isoform X2 [Branchiostoma belcheri]
MSRCSGRGYDVIEIDHLRCRTEIGFSKHEIGKKQEVVISIRLGCDMSKAGKSDDVSDSVNYRAVSKDVINYVESTSFNLVEKLATDVARICIALHKVPWVQVRVHKPQALRFSDSVGVLIERTPEDFNDSVVHLSLGSNIDPRKNLRDALALLKKKVLVLKMSSPFLTSPQLQTDQPDFINMAVRILTEMTPTELKTVLSGIEKSLLRVRDPNNKNGPRTIDLDISLWGSEVKDYSVINNDEGSNHSLTNGHVQKTVPDPDILRFAHVVVPLAEISPHMKHPTNDSTLAAVAMEITGRDDYAGTFPIVQLFR